MNYTGRSIPALPVALGLSVGIAVDSFFPLGWWCIVGIAFLGVIVWRLTRREFGTALLCLALGVLVSRQNTPAPLPGALADSKAIIAARVDRVDRTDLLTRLVISPMKAKILSDSSEITLLNRGKLAVNYHGTLNDISPGMKIEVKGTVRMPDSITDIPRQTDYNRYQKLEGIQGRMSVYSHSEIKVLDRQTDFWSRFTQGVRSYWLETIARAGFDEPTTVFMLAVLGGDDMLFDSTLEDIFRENGLAHLLAISGMHVSIIVMLLGWMFYALKFSRLTRGVFFIGLMVITGLFVIATGSTPSVCRAAVMVIVMLGCGLFERRPDPRQALAVSVSVCLLIRPMWLFSPGFQMSVIAVVGLLFYGALASRLTLKRRWVRFLLDVAVIPVIALVSTIALTIFYFHNIPLNFWLANVCGALPVPFILGSGFIAVVLTCFGFNSVFPALITDRLYGYLTDIVRLTDTCGPDSLTVFLTDVEIIMLLFSVVAVGVFLLKPRRLTGIMTLILVSSTVALVMTVKRERPRAELYVPRHSWSTDVIMTDGGKSYVLTVSKRGITNPNELIERNYRDFFRYREVPLPIQLPDPYRGENVTREGDVIIFGESAIGIVRADTVFPNRHLDYALFSGDYKGKVAKIIGRLDADTILLPRQMHHRRAAGILAECENRGQPCRYLTDRPLAITEP